MVLLLVTFLVKNFLIGLFRIILISNLSNLILFNIFIIFVVGKLIMKALLNRIVFSVILRGFKKQILLIECQACVLE
jgi:hypothetical protein